MRKQILRLFLALTLTGCSGAKPGNAPAPADLAASPPVVTDIREKLLESARAHDPGFPHDANVKLTHFSYVGHAEGPDGPIYVVSVRAVLTGMLAPRGQGYVMFFDRHFDVLGSIESSLLGEDVPLWCEGSRVFLFGRTSGVPERIGGTKNNGNAIDLSRGWEHWDLVDVYEYGSSGGIEDPVSDEAQRRAEVANWDEK